MILEEILMNKSPQKRLREFARNRFEYCLYCGETSDDLTADHIHPRQKGGSTSHWNLGPACIECNQRKGIRLGWAFSINLSKDYPSFLEEPKNRKISTNKRF